MRGTRARRRIVRPISLPCGLQRVLLKHNLRFKGWTSHVHRGLSGKFESSNVGRDSVSREIGRRARHRIVYRRGELGQGLWARFVNRADSDFQDLQRESQPGPRIRAPNPLPPQYTQYTMPMMCHTID